MKTVILTLVAMFVAGPHVPADASGVWSLRLTTSEGESAARVSVTLKQDGDRLTGTCAIESTEEDFNVAGQVTEKDMAWRCSGKSGLEVSFNGTINSTGREMTGSWTTERARGTFKGSKGRS
jgi:hypothetical protein